MSIKKLANGKWRVDVTIGVTWDGKRDRRTKTFRTKKEALAQEQLWNDEKRRMHGLVTRITLGDFVKLYWWPTKLSTLEQSSLDSYEQDLRLRVLPCFAHIEIDRIDRMSVQKMISSCDTYSTAKRARDVLRAIINDAIACGAAATNPAAGRFIFPRKPIKEKESDKRGVWLTTFEEHKPILEAAKDEGEIEKIIVLGLCFGLRTEETLGMSKYELDFEAREIHVRHAYVKSSEGNILKRTKTPESERDLPMSDYAYERLMALTKDLPKDSPVCLSKYGKRLSPNTAGKMLKRWLIANDLPLVTMQSMRHSFASACIDAGIDIAKVSAWLGHTNITTTLNRYVKTRKKDLTSAVDTINRKIEL